MAQINKNELIQIFNKIDDLYNQGYQGLRLFIIDYSHMFLNLPENTEILVNSEGKEVLGSVRPKSLRHSDSMKISYYDTEDTFFCEGPYYLGVVDKDDFRVKNNDPNFEQILLKAKKYDSEYIEWFHELKSYVEKGYLFDAIVNDGKTEFRLHLYHEDFKNPRPGIDVCIDHFCLSVQS